MAAGAAAAGGAPASLPPPPPFDGTGGTGDLGTSSIGGRDVAPIASTPPKVDSAGTKAFRMISTALAIAGFVIGAGTLLVHLGFAQVAWTSAGALSAGMALNISVISLGVAVIATILRIVECVLKDGDETAATPNAAPSSEAPGTVYDGGAAAAAAEDGDLA